MNEILKKTMYGEPVLSVRDIAKIHGLDAGLVAERVKSMNRILEEGRDYYTVNHDNWNDVKTFDLLEMSIYMSLQHPDGVVEEHPGFIYVAKDPATNATKIGRTAGKVKTRVSQLNTGRAELITEYEGYPCRDIILAEKKAHGTLSEYRTNGEWFSVDIETAKNVVLSITSEINDMISEQVENATITYREIPLFTRRGYSEIFFSCVEYSENSRLIAQNTLKNYFGVSIPFIGKITIPKDEFLAHKEEWFDVEASGDSLDIDDNCEEVTFNISWSAIEILNEILQSLPNE